MKTAITKAQVADQQSLIVDVGIQHPCLNPDNYADRLSRNSLETLDEIDFDLERIMFEELAKGLPSDIPMADW